MKFNQYLTEAQSKKFTIGGIDFEAVRYTAPIKHWRLKVPSGKILDDGSGGISPHSVPKMKADLEYILQRFGQKEFERNFDI